MTEIVTKIRKGKFHTDSIPPNSIAVIETNGDCLIKRFSDPSSTIESLSTQDHASVGPFAKTFFIKVIGISGDTTLTIRNSSPKKKVDNHIYNILNYGATGGDDDSLAVESAVISASLNGGGTVYFPPGTWRIQDVTVKSKVRFAGANWDSTRVSPVVGSTVAMFRYKESNVCSMTGWEDMYMRGLGTTEVDAIDMSSASEWVFSTNSGLKIELFKTGIVGAQQDRRPYFYGCNFWENDIGYFTNGDHTQFLKCDFRRNRIGLSGQAMYDVQITDCSFVRNDYGILPNGTIQQSQITASHFFANVFGGAFVDDRCTFSNCLVTASAGMDATSYGIYFNGSRSSWLGGTVESESGTSGFGDYAFIIDAPQDCSIRNTVFDIDNFARTEPARATYRRLNFSGNTGVVRGKFLDLQVGANGFQGTQITDNNIESAAASTLLTTGDAMIEIDLSNALYSNRISGNTFYTDTAAYLAHSLKINANGCIVKDNMARGTAGFNLTATNADTVDVNNIHKPR